jgi:predicted nucleic acid-binding protein
METTTTPTSTPPTSDPPTVPGPIYIYINAYPGVGKSTIATVLSRLIPNSRIYHYHDHLDPVNAHYDRSSKHQSYHHHIWSSELSDSVARDVSTRWSLRDTSFIFTDFQTRYHDSARQIPELYRDAAARRQFPFVSVVLTCELAENLKRVTRGKRRGKKLKDGDRLREMREEGEIYLFEQDHELVLDVTNVTREEAAEEILEHAVRVAEAYRDSQVGRDSLSWRESAIAAEDDHSRLNEPTWEYVEYSIPYA